MDTKSMVREIAANGAAQVVIATILKAGLVEKKAAASNEAEMIGRIVKFCEGKNQQPVMDAVNALAVTGSKAVVDVVKFINARTPFQFVNLPEKLRVNEQGQILFNTDSEAAKRATTTVRQALVAKCDEFDKAEAAEGRPSDLAISAKYETLYYFGERKTPTELAAQWFNTKESLKGNDKVDASAIIEMAKTDDELAEKVKELVADAQQRVAFWEAFMNDDELVVQVNQFNAETEMMEMRDCAPFKAGVSVAAFNQALKRIERASKAGQNVKSKAKDAKADDKAAAAMTLDSLVELMAQKFSEGNAMERQVLINAMSKAVSGNSNSEMFVVSKRDAEIVRRVLNSRKAAAQAETENA